MAAKPETISWHERARTLDIRTKAFINGNYVESASGATFDSINPGTGKLLARVAAGDTEDVNRAVAAARNSFKKGVWSNLAPKDRQKVLKRFAELIRNNAEELALLETLDMGKPISVSLNARCPDGGPLYRVVRRSHRQDLRRSRTYGSVALWQPLRVSRWESSARSFPGTIRC